MGKRSLCQSANVKANILNLDCEEFDLLKNGFKLLAQH